MVTREREITQTVDLCNASGSLNPAAVGWSRTPLHRCNLPGWGRTKRWEYWCVTDSDQAELTFTPFHHRSPLPGTHQCFGHDNGRIRTDDGPSVTVDGLLGWAEQVHMMW